MTRSRTPAIVGFLLGGALLLALGYIASTRSTVADRTDTVPPLTITSPSAGDVVDNPVTLHFTTPAELRRTRDGWVASGLHLHLMIDDVEIMPAADDIAAAEAGFTWRLPALEPGTHRLFLTWAGRHHGNLASRTDTLSLHVRP